MDKLYGILANVTELAILIAGTLAILAATSAAL